MPENPKSRSPRIEIRPDLWPALQVEAIARGLSPKELVNSLILAALSPRAHEFMSPCTHDPMIPSSHDTITPETIATKPPITPADQEARQSRAVSHRKEDDYLETPTHWLGLRRCTGQE